MRYLAALALALLAGCATLAPTPDALLLGEQHDALVHRDLQEQWVTQLAGRGQLGALVLEMAERGTTTAGLPAAASEQDVRRALAWNNLAWPWDRYRTPVMAAVRAGVPVLGANLSRTDLRAAMRDARLERLLPAQALAAQQQAIRQGHCNLLPEQQIGPMTRIQIARDQSMAQAIAGAAVPGKTVVLLAGAGHVTPELGIPRHLPAGLRVRPVVLPPQPPADGKDPCAELRQRLLPRASLRRAP